VWDGVWRFLSLRDLPRILGRAAGSLLDECDTALTKVRRPSPPNIAQLFPLVHGGTVSYINLGTYQICVHAHLTLFDGTALSLIANRKLSTWLGLSPPGLDPALSQGSDLAAALNLPRRKPHRSSGPMTYLPAHCVLCHLVKTLASSLPLVDLKPGIGTLKGLRTSRGGRVLYQRYLYCVYMYIHPGITHVHVLLGPNYHLTL
jgi:hypothetical protein